MLDIQKTIKELMDLVKEEEQELKAYVDTHQARIDKYKFILISLFEEQERQKGDQVN